MSSSLARSGVSAQLGNAEAIADPDSAMLPAVPFAGKNPMGGGVQLGIVVFLAVLRNGWSPTHASVSLIPLQHLDVQWLLTKRSE